MAEYDSFRFFFVGMQPIVSHEGMYAIYEKRTIDGTEDAASITAYLNIITSQYRVCP